MKTQLKNIAEVKTGVHAAPFLEGDSIYLQTKDLDSFGNIINPLHPCLLSGKKELQNHLLQNGDVVFAAKGSNNVALTIHSGLFSKGFVSTAFQIIRLRIECRPLITPQYLSWYLNQPKAQLVLKSQIRGSSPPSIPITAVKDLEIDIPNLATQKTILKIEELRTREKQLKYDIERLNEILLNNKLSKAIRL